MSELAGLVDNKVKDAIDNCMRHLADILYARRRARINAYFFI